VIRLNAIELDDLLREAGFTDDEARRKAWAVAMRESRGTVDVIGGPNANGSYDYGLFQINDIHKTDDDIDWSKILRGRYNAKIAYRWTNGGVNWSTWGLGRDGWAGHLYETNREVWERIQRDYQIQYDLYPQAMEDAKEIMERPGVSMGLLYPGAQNPHVLLYQTYLRQHLVDHNVLGDLNPKGPTDFYGKAARRMTKRAYEYAVTATGDASWGKGDLTVPGPSLIYRIGLRPLWD
jgi:hypothetical protein